MYDRGSRLIKKYKGELLIGIITTFLSIILTYFISIIFSSIEPIMFVVFALGFFVVILLGAILFNQKRLLDAKFKQVNFILRSEFGFTFNQNQFFKRQQHFTIEKKEIAHTFVNQVLQELVEKKFNQDSSVNELNLFFDSGTTITPIFPLLLNLNVQEMKGHNFHIYTNNLAGIDEIHKAPNQDEFNLNERDFSLIPGQPLNKYRATTGTSTQKFLNAMWASQEKSGKNIKNVCVLTANWFLLRKGLRRIAICARGPGHMDFKKNLFENCNFTFLLAPLGKLLPLDTLGDLNDLLPDKEDKYECFELPKNKCEQTVLVTTYRQNDSPSPLFNFSIRLRENKKSENYILCEKNFEYRLKCDRTELAITEFPHKYIRVNYQKIF
ncbi:MAG: hypothetical protein KAW12_16325 [Candidatus Aminicenantes bacterium]|nr:hypothetical protein [Candidatus Aminicenantes bacterium]